MDWYNFFAEMPDFRVDRRKKHHLVDILVIALCALVSGADGFKEIAAYGRRKEAFLRTFLSLANGIPSNDTFTRVFRHMDRCLWPVPLRVVGAGRGHGHGPVARHHCGRQGAARHGEGGSQEKRHLHRDGVVVGVFLSAGAGKGGS